jgi:DNA-binding NarL/FixJ family response regulator
LNNPVGLFTKPKLKFILQEKNMIRIGIVDDKANNRRMTKEKLQGNKNYNIVLEAINGEDFLEKMQAIPEDGLHPHIVLMDLEMPQVDGVAAIATAASLYPDVKYVVLTVFDDDDKIFKAIKAGACGYLLKEESGAVLADMLLNLWENGAGPISPSIAYKILQMVQQLRESNENKEVPNIFQLSTRELEILQLLCDGLDYKEIGIKIFISPNTVKKHTLNIYRKLHVNSKAQALRIAYTKGLI